MAEWDTTSTILNKLRDHGDLTAWNRIDARFRSPIVALAKKLGLSAADGEDVAQETLAAFAESYRRGAFDPARGRLSSWLFGIAYRQAANLRRKRAREAPGGGSDGLLADLPAENDASKVWDEQWERMILDQCLARVRGEVAAPTFEAFRLSVVENRPTEEVCATLAMSREAVYVAKHRVLKRVREMREEIEGLR